MTQINPDLSGIVDGAVGDAADWTTPMNTIINALNGGLDDSNFTVNNTNLSTVASAVSWTTFASVITGYTGTPSQTVSYMKVGKTIHLRYTIDGTSNTTGLTFTIPVAASVQQIYVSASGNNNGSALATPVRVDLAASSTTATCSPTAAGVTTGWTNSGQKSISGVLTYESAT